MALTSFYTGGTGDPVQGQRALGFQTAQGLPATSFTDILVYGGQVAPTFGKIPSQKIRSSINPEPGILAKMGSAVQPLDWGDFDLGDASMFRAIGNVLRGVTTTNPSGAHYRHVIAPEQTGATVGQYMSMLVDDTDGLPRRHHDVVFTGFTIGAAAGQNVKLLTPYVYGKVDYWGIVTQTVGTGATVPLVRGMARTENLAADATDYDIYLKKTATGAGTFVVQRGAAGGYTTTEVTITEGVWIGEPLGIAYTDAGAIVGTEDDKLELYFPTGSLATYETDDVIKIPKRRAAWSPSYGTQRLISETQTRSLYAGDTLIPLEGGWSIQVTRPGVTVRNTAGGAQPAGVTVKGPLRIQVNLERDFVDQTLQLANMQRSGVGMVFHLRLDTLIGATSTRYRCYFALPNLEMLNQPTFSVFPGATNRTEAYQLMATTATSAMSYDGISFTEPLTVVADNALTSIAS